MVGARLLVAAPDVHRDPEKLLETIRSHRVTTFHFVPSMLQAFLIHFAEHGGLPNFAASAAPDL